MTLERPFPQNSFIKLTFPNQNKELVKQKEFKLDAQNNPYFNKKYFQTIKKG